MSDQTSVTTCNFPGCENPPEPATAKPGRPPEYCADPAHNRVSAWRERRRQTDADSGVARSDAEAEAPVTMARVTGAELIRQMRELATHMAATTERLTTTLTTLGDPTAAEAEVESARAAAEQRGATAEAARAEAERRAAAADRARTEADEAAEEMSEHLADEAARAEDARDRLAEATAAHAAELERIRADAARQIEIAVAERDTAIAQAEAARDQAVAQTVDATREREELRQVLDSRACVLEEARAELRIRAERAENELDQVRAELAELRRTASTRRRGQQTD